jgi:phage gpG-like protein
VATVDITDNSAEVRAALEQAKARALEIIGGKIESYAKGLVPVDTGALRNSLTHAVDGDTVIAGSAILYAPYVELGTGKDYSPPPEWMENNAPRGAGIISRSVKPRPYLRPAVENHLDEYKNVIETELKNA